VAEGIESTLNIDPAAPRPISITGDFTFETVNPPDSQDSSDEKKKKPNNAMKASKDAEDSAPNKKGDGAKDDEKQPFRISSISLQAQRGELICVTGRVGSGKSSLLLALIGEMRAINGNVVLGGPPSYVPQRPWIQSCSLKEQILFGQPCDPIRLNKAIKACALDVDISAMADGLDTEIGGESWP
jgi:ABC-type transport system involved in cytochrome bd biosynthesis fused ATPase/permease subunit